MAHKISSVSTSAAGYTKARRDLLTYAFVSHNLHKSNDLLMGLVPLFEPIIASTDGCVFDSNNFSDAVNNFYGININPLAVEAFVPRLVKSGLLKREAMDDGTANDAISNIDVGTECP